MSKTISAEASIYLDKLRPKQNDKCSVKIRVSFNRVRKYFNTGIDLLPIDFEQVMYGQRRTAELKETLIKLNAIHSKANAILKELKIFTFSAFEEAFLEQRNVHDSVSFAFEKYIEQLKLENRVGNASSYQCAINSINSFKPRLTFAEINKSLLSKYESFMLQNGKSKTTIGIYLRSLRAIYNQQNIDKSIYPFGDSIKQYSIPTAKNIKKALSVEDIAKIYNHETITGSPIDKAKDYWIFLYLCNGMNVKDFCLLKWSDIEGDKLTYERQKTIRSKKVSKRIEVAMKPQAFEIIKKWGQLSISKSNYIFPYLEKGLSADAERKIYQQVTKTINKYMKRVALELGLNKEVTTYFARHSFATVLKRSGGTIEMISELLGHGSVKTTTAYLDSFESDQIQKATDVLTVGFNQAI